MFDQLLEISSSDGFSFEQLRQWAELATDGEQQFNDLLDRFALYVAERFINESLTFQDANDALNQIMAVCNFEAPPLFWEVYVGFEEYEVSDNPDIEARGRIQQIVRKLPGR